MAKPTKRADGRYMMRFTIEGNRFTVYGATAKECRQKELDKRQELAEGLTGSARRLTVEQWLKGWLDNRSGRLSGSSIRTNNQHLKRACRQDIKGRKFGSIKLEKLEAVHVRELQRVLADQFKTRTVNDTISGRKRRRAIMSTDALQKKKWPHSWKKQRRAGAISATSIHFFLIPACGWEKPGP